MRAFTLEIWTDANSVTVIANKNSQPTSVIEHHLPYIYLNNKNVELRPSTVHTYKWVDEWAIEILLPHLVGWGQFAKLKLRIILIVQM